MRSSRVLLCSIAAVAGAVAVAPGTPAQVPDPCPQPGFVVAPGPGSEADRNDNGAVCVDPVTGDLRDDVDPPERNYDRNGNLVVCYSPEKGVVTDDQGQGQTDNGFTFRCPGNFIPVPLFVVQPT